MPVTGRQYLLTDLDCSHQKGRSDCAVQKKGTQSFFKPISGSNAIFLLVYTALHIYVHNPISVMEKSGKLLRLEQIMVPTYFVFFLLMSTSSTADLMGGI